MIAATPLRRASAFDPVESIRYWGKSTAQPSRRKHRPTVRRSRQTHRAVGQARGRNPGPTTASPAETPRGNRWHIAFIALATIIIGAVSAVDTYWTFKNQAFLYQYEQNPVGRWLIEQDGGDVALFMTAKMVGTLIVMSAIPLLYRFRAQWGITTGTSVAGFQCLLFVYLNFGEHFVLF